MPIYQFICAHCGAEFEARQTVEAREAAPCPVCPHLARKVFMPTPYVMVPAHFKVMQNDLLPDPGDTAAWDARQGNSTSHAPRKETLREAFDKVKAWG